jgi:hypothetical protein
MAWFRRRRPSASHGARREIGCCKSRKPAATIAGIQCAAQGGSPSASSIKVTILASQAMRRAVSAVIEGPFSITQQPAFTGTSEAHSVRAGHMTITPDERWLFVSVLVEKPRGLDRRKDRCRHWLLRFRRVSDNQITADGR